VLGLSVDSLAVTVFEGDETCPRDTESAELWKQQGMKEENIFYLPKAHNWWGPAGVTGPCGPDTEIFYINPEKQPCGENCSPACDCGRYLEIWNNVFMQFFKDAEGNLKPLSQRNVDTGMGVERTLCALNGLSSVYESDLFDFAIKFLEDTSGKTYGADKNQTAAMRIIADHTRTSVFVIGDVKGVTPSNVDQGYVLRRIIRRAMRYCRLLEIPYSALLDLAKLDIEYYGASYPFIKENGEKILDELSKEQERFAKTIEQGLKEFDKILKFLPTKAFPGKTAFRLYDTFGFPIEMTEELATENGYTVDKPAYEECFRQHQEKSKAGAEQKFKGGLADAGEVTAKLHSATHLLNRALKIVLKDETIQQRGSNITPERLRFDFNFPRPLTEEEIKAIEDFVNNEISANTEIVCAEMTVDEAKAKGAVGVFGDRYGEKVKVYTIGSSMEICGGPHAGATGELGKFKIQKEQSSSAGVRRIKAVLL
jgi:alanyl-tRNA synthetase